MVSGRPGRRPKVEVGRRGKKGEWVLVLLIFVLGIVGGALTASHLHYIAGHGRSRNDKAAIDIQRGDEIEPRKEVSFPQGEADEGVLGETGEANVLDKSIEETLKRDKRSSPVLASFVTGAMKEFLINWVKSAASVGRSDSIFVGAFDQTAADICDDLNVDYVKIFEANGSSTTDFGAVATGGVALDGTKVNLDHRKGAAAFMQIGVQKAAFIQQLLKEKSAVLVSDVDVAFVNDPYPYVESILKEATFDFAVSSDCVSFTGDQPDSSSSTPLPCFMPEVNTGMTIWRATKRAHALLQEWRDAMVNPIHEFEHDQGALNRILKEKKLEKVGPREVIATTAMGAVRIFLLPISKFLGGHTYFVQRVHERHGIEPLMVHTTFQFSQSLGKRQRLRTAGLWASEEEEYYSEGDFIKITDDLPPHLASGRGLDAHLELSLWYRRSLRAAFALGDALNRIVIMPDFKCGCDRYWNDLTPSCSLPGVDAMDFPFSCPMDHLFYLGNLVQENLQWRESTFLSNPRVPKELRDSRKRVVLRGNEGGGSPEKDDDNVLVDKMSTDSQLKEALGKFSQVRVLEVHDAANILCGLVDAEEETKFNAKMERALSAACTWCGIDLREPKTGEKVCTNGFAMPPRLDSKGQCAT